MRQLWGNSGSGAVGAAGRGRGERTNVGEGALVVVLEGRDALRHFAGRDAGADQLRQVLPLLLGHLHGAPPMHYIQNC